MLCADGGFIRRDARNAVWSNGVKCLKAFGLDPMPYAGQMDRMAYRKHDTGETFTDFSLEPLYTRVRPPSLSL